MRALVCPNPYQLAIKDVPKPSPRPLEALVRVHATGVCGSDVRGYLGTHPEIPSYPVILGHEFAGVVEELGAGAEGPPPGTRVAVEPLFVCGVCRGCLRGDYHLCSRLELNGHQHPGSFAEWTVSPARFCYPVPETMDFETAALAEPVAVAVHAANRARPALGDLAVVLGVGPIGLLTLQTLRLSGCRVLATDIVPSKLEVAAGLGAERVVNAAKESVQEAVLDWTGGVGADLVMETAGSATTLGQTIHLIRKGGTIVLVGFTGEAEDPLCLTKVMVKEARVLGSVIYGWGDFPDAIRLLATGAIRWEEIVTHRCELDGLADVLVAACDKSGGMLKPMCVIP
jgi:L-iditol 2-dehydrogenase